MSLCRPVTAPVGDVNNIMSKPSVEYTFHKFPKSKSIVRIIDLYLSYFILNCITRINAAWTLADKNGDGKLSYKEITHVLGNLNLKMKDKDAKKKFKDVDVDGSGTLSRDEFSIYVERLLVRPEIEAIFSGITSGKKHYLTPEEFLAWLQKEQKETSIDLEGVKKLIAEFEKPVNGRAPENLYNTGFAQYLVSPKNNYIFKTDHGSVYHDMTQPFAHYYIDSSHNTYLLGDQLKGESSVEAYKNALKRGCRCVELDCWDGPDKSVPIIYHGHTLTSKITFKEVLETVRDFGFVASEYPVILSLEVHCGLQGQEAMATLIKEVLGSAGLLPPQPDVTGELPSPEKLKKKVLLKGKMVNFKDEEDEAANDAENSKKSDSKRGSTDPAHKPETTAKELSELIHLKAVSFKTFAHSKDNCKAWEMSSFSEGKLIALQTKSAAELIEYNSRQLSRIYPKGMRVDSSNYDPVPAWIHGSQIVALNYQTPSEPMFLNDGKFMDNGGCGYLLKPKILREPNPKVLPEGKSSVQKTLNIEIISGWQLPKPDSNIDKGEIIDPYVRVTLAGVTADKKTQKTKVINNNGFNPVWNASFKYPVQSPDNAILLFLVADSDFVTSDDLIGFYSLPLNSIREGYRVVPLKDKHGQYFASSSLLVHIKFT